MKIINLKELSLVSGGDYLILNTDIISAQCISAISKYKDDTAPQWENYHNKVLSSCSIDDLVKYWISEALIASL